MGTCGVVSCRPGLLSLAVIGRLVRPRPTRLAGTSRDGSTENDKQKNINIEPALAWAALGTLQQHRSSLSLLFYLNSSDMKQNVLIVYSLKAAAIICLLIRGT